MTPETRYARSGDVHLAYQVVGEGPGDLLYVPGWVSNVEVAWEHPGLARFFGRLASFRRLILFDKRGTGLSDRVPTDRLPTLEQRMDDLRAVLDAAGSERAALFGHSEGGNLCVLYAATYPDRVEALVTFAIFARRIRSEDYPWAPTPEERDAWLEVVEREWGGEADLRSLAPSVADDLGFRAWWGRYMRQSASPAAAAALGRMNTSIDITGVLPTIRVPTLLLHREGDQDARIDEARFIAERIPGARLIELPGADHIPWTPGMDDVLDEVERFLTGDLQRPAADRVLSTVVFTDIVDSTRIASDAGDARWRATLEAHDALVRRLLEKHRGREVKTTGDGFLATFDGPARAVRCARAIRDAVGALDLRVRAGIHTGECEVRGDDVGGIAVHVAARLLSEAAPDEVLVSGTVVDLVAGSGLAFADRGERALKGIEGLRRVYAAA